MLATFIVRISCAFFGLLWNWILVGVVWRRIILREKVVDWLVERLANRLAGSGRLFAREAIFLQLAAAGLKAILDILSVEVSEGEHGMMIIKHDINQRRKLMVRNRRETSSLGKQQFIFIMRLKRVKEPQFTPEGYAAASNPSEYLRQALLRQCDAKSINPALMNITDLNDILSSLRLSLKRQQLHELFLFSTALSAQEGREQRRLMDIIENKKMKIELKEVCKWICNKIEHKKITFVPSKTYRSASGFSHAENHKLPPIASRETQFENEVKKVLGIFQNIEKERQNMGLVPVSLQSEDDDPERLPTANIPYDADFFEVNQKIFQLRSEAQHCISNIISAAKSDKKLQAKLEKSIGKYGRVRTEANEKIGRGGAMKAHKRMIDRSNREVQRLEEWRRMHINSLFT